MAGRHGGLCAGFLSAWLAIGPAAAQEGLPDPATTPPAADAGNAVEAPFAAPILTLDQDRFFAESRFGRAAREREQAAIAALEAENAAIERDLIAEEQTLTELRKTLSAEEFAARAVEFDAKVERIRGEQDAKARDITALREGDRQEFLEVAVPVLGELLDESGAVAIVDKAAIILSRTTIDVTDEAIARIDRAGGPDDAAPAPTP